MVFAAVALAMGYLMGRGKEIHISHEPLAVHVAESWCPNELPPLVSAMTHRTTSLYHRLMSSSHPEADDLAFNRGWADEFSAALFLSAMPLSMQLSRRRIARDVEIPTKMGSTQTLCIGKYTLPEADLDAPYNLVPEKYVPRILRNMVLDRASTCYSRALRRLPFLDGIDGSENNTWAFLTDSGRVERKRDWVAKFFEPYTLMDGTRSYPAAANDLAGLFLKDSSWDDGLEKALAFDLIGAHRVHLADKTMDGLALAFVLPLNSMASADVRDGFQRYGGDMYFDAGGMPALIETPSGEQVKPQNDTWQYWKWVWRSSLVGGVTLVDHLYLTHFRIANIVSRLSRSTLPPNHFFRRFLSVFTFGSIDANRAYLHTLAGRNHTLHRSTPFKDFDALSSVVPATMTSLTELHERILRDEAFEALPARIRESPYYADGRLLAGALRNLTKRVLGIYLGDDCSQTGSVQDPHLTAFRNSFIAQDAEAGYAATVEGAVRCSDLEDLVLAIIWTLTGWHRHVGAVGDYLTDPDLAGLSWKEGESFARPRQSVLATLVAAVTSLPQPRLDDDFTHLFLGVEKEHELVEAWGLFREELREVRAAVQQRNAGRRVKNFNADPSLVDCSAAV